MAPSSNRPGRSPFKAEMLSSNLTGVILAPSTNRNRWPPPQGGDTGSSPVGVIRTVSGLGSSGGLKHRRSSFDSNSVHHVRGKRARSLFCAQDLVIMAVCKTARDGSNPSVHLRPGVMAALRTLDPAISVRPRWPPRLIRSMERTEDF